MRIVAKSVGGVGGRQWSEASRGEGIIPEKLPVSMAEKVKTKGSQRVCDMTNYGAAKFRYSEASRGSTAVAEQNIDGSYAKPRRSRARFGSRMAD